MGRSKSYSWASYNVYDSSQQQRIIGPNMSVVARLRNPGKSSLSWASWELPHLSSASLLVRPSPPTFSGSSNWRVTVCLQRDLQDFVQLYGSCVFLLVSAPALSVVKYLEYFINIYKIWSLLSISLPGSSQWWYWLKFCALRKIIPFTK